MAPSIPPPLAPSVEEAYRRKCIQLKARTKEIEDTNDAARVRLARLQRQVEKQRLERAFLLEQLARRTSTNVEDSEGSPSPPPTVSRTPPPGSGEGLTPEEPKEKPLRTKRGHRKPSVLANLDTAAPAGATFISQNPQTLSPSSDAFSHTHADSQSQSVKEPRANGSSKAPKRPGNAFELYCADTRSLMVKDGVTNIEEELARGWKDLPQDEKEEFESRADEALIKYKKAKGDSAQSERPPPEKSQAGDTPAPQDEDVEMANSDTEAEPPEAEAGEGDGY